MMKIDLDLTNLTPGERLRRIRGMRGVRGPLICRTCGVHQANLSKFELGNGDHLKPDQKEKIAKLLGVPTRAIFGDLKG